MQLMWHPIIGIILFIVCTPLFLPLTSLVANTMHTDRKRKTAFYVFGLIVGLLFYAGGTIAIMKYAKEFELAQRFFIPAFVSYVAFVIFLVTVSKAHKIDACIIPRPIAMLKLAVLLVCVNCCIVLLCYFAKQSDFAFLLVDGVAGNVAAGIVRKRTAKDMQTQIEKLSNDTGIRDQLINIERRGEFLALLKELVKMNERFLEMNVSKGNQELQERVEALKKEIKKANAQLIDELEEKRDKLENDIQEEQEKIYFENIDKPL